MLLTIDLGNSYCKFGLFEDDKRIAFDMVKTKETEDYKAFILPFIYKAQVRENMIEAVIMSSVVPSEREVIKGVIKEIFNIEPIEINCHDDYGIKIGTDDPNEVGSDIIVMAAYGYHLYHRDFIVGSFGTYSVIFYVDEEGTFKNCIIAPGYKRIIRAMSLSSEQLPDFENNKKDTFIATNTKDAMSVGFFSGFIGMVEYLVKSLEKEIGKDIYKIACGGISKEIAPYTQIFDVYETDFVSDGLNYIYNRCYRG